MQTHGTSTNPRKQHRPLFFVLLPLLCLAVYGPVLDFDFLSYDDNLNIYNNPGLKGPLGKNLAAFWTNPYELLFIPATYTFWAITAYISRFFSQHLAPAYFHAANLMVHIANVTLVFGILILILDHLQTAASVSRKNLAAGLGALFFGLHPLTVEPVAWITGMKTLLSGFFALLSIFFYLQWMISGNNRRRPAFVSSIYIASLASYILGLLAMPTIIMVPLILWIAALVIRHEPMKKTVKQQFLPLLPFLLTALFFAGLTIMVMPQPETGPMDLPWYTRPLIACDALIFYIGKLFFPLHLSIDYGKTPAAVLNTPLTYITPFLLGGLVILSLVTGKQNRLGCAALGIIFAGVLPVLGLIPFEFQKISTVADRYFYLSLLGGGFALSAAAIRLPKKIIPLFLLVVLAFGMRSTFQVRLWNNTATLMNHVYTLNPDSHIANLNLGNALLRRGKFKKALFYLQKAARLRPDHPYSLYNLGVAYVGLHDRNAAMRCYERLRPRFPRWAAKLQKYIRLLDSDTPPQFVFE